MKFIALLRKELREGLPWIVLAGVVFLFFGGLILQEQVRRFIENPRMWHYQAGSELRIHSFVRHPMVGSIGAMLLLCSIGLGIVLGGRQFWVPRFTRTWAFTLHRSVSRRTVLAAKASAAVLGFVLSLGLLWTLLFIYASRPGVLPYPPAMRSFAEGWIFILLGLLVYLATALAGLSQARWYTTKMCGLGLAILISILAMTQASLVAVIGIILAGATILGVQVLHLIESREF